MVLASRYFLCGGGLCGGMMVRLVGVGECMVLSLVEGGTLCFFCIPDGIQNIAIDWGHAGC